MTDCEGTSIGKGTLIALHRFLRRFSKDIPKQNHAKHKRGSRDLFNKYRFGLFLQSRNRNIIENNRIYFTDPINGHVQVVTIVIVKINPFPVF